jgi:hypothetical protein
MPNYANGKIYKLINTEGTLCYVGSTTQNLSTRKAEHHSKYKRWKNGKSKYVTSFKIFDDDEDGCQIILLEDFPCESRAELEKQERHHIESMECINKYRPTRTDKEYYEDNKDTIKQRMIQYREDNKETIKQKMIQYREDNKETIKQKKNEIHNCACGTKYTRANKARHLKTIKHQQYINSINPQQDA